MQCTSSARQMLMYLQDALRAATSGYGPLRGDSRGARALHGSALLVPVSLHIPQVNNKFLI